MKQQKKIIVDGKTYILLGKLVVEDDGRNYKPSKIPVSKFDEIYNQQKNIVVQPATTTPINTVIANVSSSSKVKTLIDSLPDLQGRLAGDLIGTGKFNLSNPKDVAALQTALFISKIETNFSYSSAYTSTGGGRNNMLGPWQFNRAYTGNLSKEQQLEKISNIVLGIDPTPSAKGRFDPNITAKYLQNAKTADDIRRAIIAGGLTSIDFDPLDNPLDVNSRTGSTFTNKLLQVGKSAFGAEVTSSSSSLEVVSYTSGSPSNPDVRTPSNQQSVFVPDTQIQPSPVWTNVPTETLDGIAKGSNDVVAQLNEQGSDTWTQEQQELFKSTQNILDSINAEKATRKSADCKTKQTDKGVAAYVDPPKCEAYINSTAYQEALQTYETERVQPDPCGTSELAGINTQLLSFFKTLKKIKKFGQLYVNGVINKVGQISNLIRNTGSIIAAILKILIQRLRNFLIGKIRAGIQDLIDLLMPTVAKAIKNTIIQKVIDTIFCKFKDIVKGLAQMVGDFLFELVGKIVNVPFCAAQQWTNSLINKLAADIDKAIGPVLDKINDVLGQAGKIAGSVFQALDFILGFESFLCAKPNCPQIKSFIGNPLKDGPNQQDIDNFNNFLSIPSDSAIIEGATGWTKDLPIFGGTLGQYDGTLPDSIGQCDTAPFRCGPPSIEIFGGGGFGAIGNAVVDKIGKIVGVDLVFGGLNYSSPPFVTILDPCQNGNYASAYAEINDDGEVINIVMVNNGAGYVSKPTGLNEFDEPVEQDSTRTKVNDYIVCLSGFEILSTGIGYKPTDIVKITPNLEGLEAVIRMTESGQIIEIKLADRVCGITDIPEIVINSDTGSGVDIKPVFEIIRLNGGGDGGAGQIDLNAIPNISIDSTSRRVLDPKTRRDITIEGRIARDDELRATTSTGQRNIIRVIDCVR